jgi:hypothetical protein
MSAIKHDKGKPRLELLSVPALNQIAGALAFGAGKYGDHNWREGFDWSRLYGAALRHLTAHMDGEDKDPESGLSHLAHLGCCVMFLLEHEARGLGKDDRYKATTKEDNIRYTVLDNHGREVLSNLTLDDAAHFARMAGGSYYPLIDYT